MLTMEQVYNIKYMRKFEGKSLRKIAKITGHDFSKKISTLTSPLNKSVKANYHLIEILS